MTTTKGLKNIFEEKSLPLPIRPSSEEVLLHGEVSKLLEQLLCTLGPNGETSLAGQKFEELRVKTVKSYHLLQKKILFIQAVKEVLDEEEQCGCQTLPKKKLDDLMDQINLVEMEEEYVGGASQLLGLNEAAKPRRVKLNSMLKHWLIGAVHSKLYALSEKIGPTDYRKELVESDISLCNTLLDMEEKAQEQKQLSSQYLAQAEKLSNYSCGDFLEQEKMATQLAHIKTEVVIHKARLEKVNLARSLSSDLETSALAELIRKNQEELAKVQEMNIAMKEKLREYEALPAPEFTALAKKHLDIQKKIEDAKWTLEKLNNK